MSGAKRMIRPWGAVLLAAFALSACSTLESIELDNLLPEAWPWADKDEPSADQTVVTNGELPPTPKSKPETAAAISIVQIDPKQLVGLDFDSTKALLGDPARQLEQPPAKVWAYNGKTCVFNVFFYPSVDDDVFRVLTYEVAGGAPAGESPEAADSSSVDKKNEIARRCFTNLLQAMEEPDSG